VSIGIITTIQDCLLIQGRPPAIACIWLGGVTSDHLTKMAVTPVGHTNRSAISKNSMLHANFMALCFIEPELLPMEVLHSGYRDFRPFSFCDLDLDPMTFIYERDPYSLEIHRMCKYDLHTSRLSKVIVWQTDKETDRQTRSRVVNKTQNFRRLRKAPVYAHDWKLHKCGWQETKGRVITNCVRRLLLSFCVFPNIYYLSVNFAK